MAAKRQPRLGKKRLFYDLMILAVVLMIAARLTLGKNQNGTLEVSFIDVGQGDCSLIKTPDGSTLLIDGGEAEQYDESVEPFLIADGIWNISSVMASHYHSDHAGGILETIKSGAAGSLIIPNTEDTGEQKEKLKAAASKREIKVMEADAGDKIMLGDDDIRFEVLFPDKGLYVNTDKNLNNDSIVLRLDYHDLSFLFTGDLEEEAERVLINSGMLRADVLKVGHHGSSTSSSDEFLNAVMPEYAVIEAGKNNKYGHPHKEILNSLKERSVKIYRTDVNGNITFSADENGIIGIQTEKK